MISNRTADLFEKVKNQRDKITLLVVITSINGDDSVFFWFYDSKGNMIKISDLNKFLWQVIQNALRVTDLDRSFTIRWEDMLSFDPKSKAFIQENSRSNSPSVQGMRSTTMQDFYMAMKRGSQYFVGESEHYFNEQGTCFGVIEIFKPKYETSSYVRFKDADGQWVSGMVTGLHGPSGEYIVSHDGYETEVREVDLFPSNIVGASVSFRKKADLINLVQEKERQKQELEASKSPESLNRFPLDTIEEQQDVNNIIKDVVVEFMQKMENYWEAYSDGSEPTTLESGDGPGFFNHTDGGYEGNVMVSLDSFVSSGGYPSNKEIAKMVRENEAESYKEAMQHFVSSNKDKLAQIGLDPMKPADLEKINYHDLYEMGHGDLAEDLSESETDSQHNYDYNFYCKVFYYNPNNRNKEKTKGLPEIQFQAGMQYMAKPLVFKRFAFRSLYELKYELNKCLNQSLKALE